MTTLLAREPETEPPEPTDRARASRPRPARPSTAGRVLELQRSAGNRAVAAMLAREPTRDAPAAKAPLKGPHSQLTVPDIGTIELDSWSLGEPGRGSSGHSVGKVSVRDATLTSTQGPHSAALARATASGTPLGTVVLEASKDGKVYMRLTLHDAMVSSYQLSGSDGRANPREAWTLNASKIDFEVMEQSTAADEPASPPG